MLLPSDVARLVLGYLQEEGLAATSQAFILESPNLKEYVEHTTGDGTIPACVFSIFGKGLTTILNEYVAARTKDSCPKVPAVMSSLWKKLDFTLNQIKSLQNSPSISACQRTRSRIGVANMSRQRVLTMASAGSIVCSSVSETSSIISPAHTAHSMLSHSTPVSYTAPQNRLAPGTNQQIHDGSRLISTPRDSPVHIVVSENRLNPGPMSPGRRKWDTPRKRSGALGGASGPGRSAMTVSSLVAEPQPEEVVDENFPQLVIQNARDKILGDRSLQEKLAENINKILANEPTPQTSKASTTTMETDQSIDEILGLQGEIHMSDDAIHDILEQTESDPAFQALFDLFDYNKSKFTEGEQGDGDVSSSPEDSDAAGSSSTVRPLQCDDPGTAHEDTSVSDITTLTAKTRAGQDRKTRKSAAPILLKKTLLAPSGRASRIEGSSARLLVSHGEPQAVSSSAGGSNRKERTSFFTNSVGVTPMDIDEAPNTPPPPLASMAPSDRTSTNAGLDESTKVPSSDASAAFVPSVASLSSNMVKKYNHKQPQGSKEQPNIAPSLVFINQPALMSPAQVELNSTTTPTADPFDMPVSSSVGDSQPVSSQSVPAESASYTTASPSVTVTAVPPSSSASTPAPFTATTGSSKCISTAVTATPASSTAALSACFSSSAPVTAVPNPSSVKLGAPSKAATDSSNIVSLKIIISDNHEEDSSNDTALNQAISSISGDKIPTIYLSSPAKPPGTLHCPGTPKANLDEVAQAVSGLQNSEAHASPLSGKAGALMASSLTGTPQGQQSYIIQLPLDTTNPALPGANASYLLVTEPPTTDTQTRQVLVPAGVSKGQLLPKKQFGGTTPTCSQGYPAGPALILPSTVKPMMLPVSVMGQNTLGNVQVVSNQLVTIPNPVSIQQSESVMSSPSTVMIKQSTTAAGTEENVIQPLSAENTSQQDEAKGPSHRRILCFDSSGGVQPQTPRTHSTTPSPTTTSTSQPIQKLKKDNTPPTPRTKPAILGGNKPKRRVEITRCSVDPQTAGALVKDAEKSILPQHQHKDPVKKNPRKQHHNIYNQESQSTSENKAHSSQPETSKKLESGRRSKSVDREQTCDTNETKADDCHIKSLTSNPAPKSETKNEKEENSRKEPSEKDPAKTREGRTEKRNPSEEMPNVTANKENEIKGSMQEQQQQSTSASSASRDISPSAVPQPKSSSQSTATKAPSKTSSLVKQAAEMLQDIQGLKKPGVGSSDMSLPRTPSAGCNQEHSAESPRTPSQKKNGKDGEGTPIRLMPPNTPDVPSCSPASEAGSENSINMAAHTLMILSRAAIARTGTPLKDSLRQDGVGEKSPSSSKNSKKRKQSSPTDSLPSKESKRSPSRKKDREKKRLIDCFPHDLDVDKFLSSLHYDE